MKWNQLKVNCDTAELDTVAAVMSMLDEGLMIDDYSDAMEGANKVYGELVDESILTADVTRAAVSIFVEESINLEGYFEFINSHLACLAGKYDIEVISSDEDDWRYAWRKYYKPTRIQSLAVGITALILSPEQSAWAMILYLVMGALGLPVFSGGTAGVGKLFGVTGGYYFGFLISAVAVSLLKGKGINLKRYMALTVGVAMPIQHLCGVVMMCLHNGFDVKAAFVSVSLPFIAVDIIKSLL